jgi:LysM repeat protein
MEKKMFNGKDRNHRSEEITYTIKKGDTLWGIANEMGVNIDSLSRWNNLRTGKKLIPGDQLKIRMKSASVPLNDPLREKEGKEIIYVVKEGDTLSNIAKKYNLTISEIKTWNRLDEEDRIYPGNRMKVRVGEIKSSTLN